MIKISSVISFKEGLSNPLTVYRVTMKKNLWRWRFSIHISGCAYARNNVTIYDMADTGFIRKTGTDEAKFRSVSLFNHGKTFICFIKTITSLSSFFCALRYAFF